MAITPQPSIDPTPLPAPQRGDSSTFSDRLDAFVRWLTVGVGQFSAATQWMLTALTDAYNQVLAAAGSATSAAASATLAQTVATSSVAAVDLVATSSTTNSLGSGIKNCVIQTGKQFKPGMPMRWAVTASPGNRMDGYVRTYDPATGALSMQVEQAAGTPGTSSSAWTITITGATNLNSFYGGGFTGSYSGLNAPVYFNGYYEKMQRFSGNLSGAEAWMPDPFEVPEGYNIFEIYNEQGGNDLTLRNSAGETQGFLPGGRSTAAHLLSFPNNEWLFPEASAVGIPLKVEFVASGRIAGTAGVFVRMVVLDADRLLFLLHGIQLHAVVYEISTNTWGTLTLVRSAVWSGTGSVDNVRAILIGTDSVLVASCPEATTALYVQTLSISGFTITANTPLTTAATGTGSARLLDFLIVGSTYVLAWLVPGGTGVRLRAHTVAAGLVVAGAEATVTVGVAPPAVIAVSSTVVAVVGSSTGTLTVTPLTVSAGTTLTANTAATTTVSVAAFRLIKSLIAGRWLIVTVNSVGRIFGLDFTGSTAAISAGLALSSVVSSITSVQAQLSVFNVQIAVTGVDSLGTFLTEFVCVADNGPGIPSLVGSPFRRGSPAAQTVAPLGTDDNGATGSATQFWSITTAKTNEVHAFQSNNVTFLSRAQYRAGPMSVAMGLPPLALYPNDALHPSVLHKFGAGSWAALGDGSKAATYSKPGTQFGTMRNSPVLVADPASGCKGVDQSSLWLAHSYGTDANVTLEQVKLA